MLPEDRPARDATGMVEKNLNRWQGPRHRQRLRGALQTLSEVRGSLPARFSGSVDASKHLAE